MFIVKYQPPQCGSARLQPLIDAAYGTLAMHVSTVGIKTALRVGFSGGKDSMVVAHLASFLPEFEGVAHVRTHTGPASEQHSNHVSDLAAQFGWHMIERSPTELLPSLVAQFGFPGPAAHTWMFIKLKERGFRKISPAARPQKGRLVFAMGIRADESAKREANATEVTQMTKTEWWVNPILSWSDADVWEYISAFGLKVSAPHHSLDCWCGAYATPEEIEMVAIEHPEQYEYLRLMEDIAKAGHSVQALEVKYGHRKTAFSEQFCTWGHGLNAGDVRAGAQAKAMLCSHCKPGALSVLTNYKDN